MPHKIKSLFLFLLLLPFYGCTLVLVPPTRPLEEMAVAGRGRDKILLIDISGVISSEEESGIGGLQAKESMVANIRAQLDKAAGDRNVKAVVLRINSPGGTVTASDIIYHQLLQYKRVTGQKITACFMDLGTSGAYYIAQAADTIVAHPTTVTGSVGVMILTLNAEKLMQTIGVKSEAIKSGDKKDIMFPTRQMSDEEKALVQKLILTLNQRFHEIIAANRPKAQLDKIADGRILSAQEALELGLVDQIGYLDEAVGQARKTAGLSEARVIMYQPPTGYRDNIYAMSSHLPSQINLVNFDLGKLGAASLSPKFMYMWQP